MLATCLRLITLSLAFAVLSAPSFADEIENVEEFFNAGSESVHCGCGEEGGRFVAGYARYVNGVAVESDSWGSFPSYKSCERSLEQEPRCPQFRK